IIETSRTVQQERSGFAGLSEKIKSVRCSFLKVIEAVLDCIALPRPAFAILTVVIMAAGIVFGSYTGKTWSVSSLNSGFSLAGLENSRAYDSSDVETFVMVTDSFEYGDFL
ncbi:MAG: hypothetical protein KAJ40_06715, partial [Alphaproteobacteria bacterium]|nr:hypothetical protein [Alphaproteobacteria bacterium]